MAWNTIHPICHALFSRKNALFSRKNKKKYFRMSSAAADVIGALRINGQELDMCENLKQDYRGSNYSLNIFLRMRIDGVLLLTPDYHYYPKPSNIIIQHDSKSI